LPTLGRPIIATIGRDIKVKEAGKKCFVFIF